MSVHVATMANTSIGELYCPACELSYPNGSECPKDGTRLVILLNPVDSIVGRDIDGRFTILERLGQGGMGAVYRASQHSVGREVAIKVVHGNLASDPAVIKRFLREARLASKLNHPNAVGVLDFGQTVDGLFYLVMELVHGRTLASVFEQDGVFDARRLIRVGMQVCEALEAAHQLSIIHRDLKPANIMVLDAGRDIIKVLDFGLAKSIMSESASEMTGSNNLVGTPAFMPPERAVGGSGDARSDLYSLGCILYLLGSGQPPFVSDNMQELLMKQVASAAPPMVNVPIALAAVIDRLLLKSPDLRYQTAAETREALDDVLADLPALPRRPTMASVPISAVALTPVRETSSPSIAVDAKIPSSPSIERARLVEGDTLLAPSEGRRRRARWPWVVSLSVLTIAIMAIAFSGDKPAARAPVDPPIVVIPVPTPVVTPMTPTTPTVVPTEVLGTPATPASAKRPVRPIKPLPRPRGPQFPF